MIIHYETEPEYRKANEQGHIQLTKDWLFWIDYQPFWIPSGYICDGASIPRIFWTLVGSPFQPDIVAAAFAHDWFYLTHIVDRSEADEVLFQIAMLCGVSKFRARIIWSAVRSFGALAWKNGPDEQATLYAVRRDCLSRSNPSMFRMNEIRV